MYSFAFFRNISFFIEIDIFTYKFTIAFEKVAANIYLFLIILCFYMHFIHSLLVGKVGKVLVIIKYIVNIYCY